MGLRISTASKYAQFLRGIRRTTLDINRAQEQIATGRSLLRPSDNPTGIARVLSLSRQLADTGRFRDSIDQGLVSVDSAAATLQDASELLSNTRALLVQAMNGTLSPEDRASIASEIELTRVQLLELGNFRTGNRYVFGGTITSSAPWREETVGGRTRVVYEGNREAQRVRVGNGIDLPINVPGDALFAKIDPQGTAYSGLTGADSGLTADQGAGYETLFVRHDSTDPGTLGLVGITLAGGGSDDTLLGDNTITINPALNTIQLGSGPSVPLPEVGSAGEADFVLRNEKGGELHLDMTGYTGAGFSGTVRGEGSVSFDGSTYTPLTFTENDLRLENPASGAVIHLDATNVKRAGEELVTFEGTVNAFDLMQGIAEDIRNDQGLTSSELLERLNDRLVEIDRVSENLLVGMGSMGSLSQRLKTSADRVEGLEVQVQGLLSEERDTDFSVVAIELAQASNNLQLAQASGARLIQTSLLNFLN